MHVQLSAESPPQHRRAPRCARSLCVAIQIAVCIVNIFFLQQLQNDACKIIEWLIFHTVAVGISAFGSLLLVCGAHPKNLCVWGLCAATDIFEFVWLTVGVAILYSASSTLEGCVPDIVEVFFANVAFGTMSLVFLTVSKIFYPRCSVYEECGERTPAPSNWAQPLTRPEQRVMEVG